MAFKFIIKHKLQTDWKSVKTSLDLEDSKWFDEFEKRNLNTWNFGKNANVWFSKSNFLIVLQKIKQIPFTIPCQLLQKIFLAWTISKDPN